MSVELLSCDGAGDGHDDYMAFEKNADPANTRMLRQAFGNLPHFDKCEKEKHRWNEWHPTPFKEIASMKHNPFKYPPFKFQYENDPTGYFLETCNAISNGYTLTAFNAPELKSVNNCGSDPGFALECIDEDHLLQSATAAMSFGSWYMHGLGGGNLGGFIDVKGMDVQFYFYYRLVLKAYVPDANIRKQLSLCSNVPDESDGIQWVDANGEKLCHLYFARQMKKIISDGKMVKADDRRQAKIMLKGVPDMMVSIAAFVFVTCRAIFHDSFPYGADIYTKIMTKTVDALMATASPAMKQQVKSIISLLKVKGIVLGFEDPVNDGGSHLLGILSDFMDYAFFQEQMKMGPGSAHFKRLIPRSHMHKTQHARHALRRSTAMSRHACARCHAHAHACSHEHACASRTHTAQCCTMRAVQAHGAHACTTSGHVSSNTTLGTRLPCYQAPMHHALVPALTHHIRVHMCSRTAGCTLDPHAVSHRKAAKIIRRFIGAIFFGSRCLNLGLPQQPRQLPKYVEAPSMSSTPLRQARLLSTSSSIQIK